MAQPERRRVLHVRGHRPAPARQPQRAERAGLGQGKVGPDVGHLVKQERKADLRLRHAQLAQVEVDHGLAELRQAGARGLHAVPVGHVEEVNNGHVRCPLGCGLRADAIHSGLSGKLESILIKINLWRHLTRPARERE